MKQKIKVGSRVKWKAGKVWLYGKVERIESIHSSYRPIKVRPEPQYRGQRPTLTSFISKTLTVV